MDTLSVEIVQQIAEFLDDDSVLKFSLVNRPCRLASKPRIFHTVRVSFASLETLCASIERFENSLTSSESYRHVRNLQVVAAHLFELRLRLEDCGDRPQDTWRYCAIDRSRSKPVEDNMQWQRLAGLIRQLSALHDLTWACEEQLPPCILRSISAIVPRCRLHLQNFTLRSLLQPPDAILHMDPDELELATSPCLYSLAMRYDHIDSSGNADYNENAVMDMVAGAAPNLRKISLLWESSGSSPDFVRAARIPRQQWKHGQKLGCTTTSRGALEELELVAQDTWESLKSWDTLTNFTVLRILRLHYPLRTAGLRWLTDHCHFASLDTLVVNLHPDAGDSSADLAEATERFLLSLPPLNSFKMAGVYEQRTAYLAMDHCGPHLRRLYLPIAIDKLEDGSMPSPTTFATRHFLHTLRRRCPFLEELAICVLRTQGDAREVAVYQALGEIPALRTLHLSVYSSQAFTWNTDLLTTIENSHAAMQNAGQHFTSEVGTALIDLAIDKALARSVFYTISTAKASNARPLESLQLRVDALRLSGGFESSFNLIKLLKYIGRSWRCVRDQRDDHAHHCLVDEYDSEEQLDRKEMEESGELADILNSLQYAQVVQSVWPRSHDQAWEGTWHSFPLAGIAPSSPTCRS